MNIHRDPSSFRDPDGFVFEQNGEYFRAVCKDYSKTWEKLAVSSFFQDLLRERKLLPCEKATEFSEGPETQDIHQIYRIPRIPVITYPPEWSFAQFKKAALLTLRIQKKALQNGFSLKDASAYNVQWIGRQEVFIDHLSFEDLQASQPWQAYAQFCRHFLAPLLLWHYGVPEPQRLFLNHLDGIPLQHCSRLLPWRSKFSLLAYTHIHLHARFETKHAQDQKLDYKGRVFSLQKHLRLIEHLEMGITAMRMEVKSSNWSDYYDTFSYSGAGLDAKQAFVKKHLEAIRGNLCVDLGANSGMFSFMAADYFQQVLACDADEQVLKQIRRQKKDNVLAIQVDLTNPLPAYGWNSNERKSFLQRIAHNDLTLALALVHHLCIANNLPIQKLAEFFSGCSQHLLIEFVPKEDEQVRRLLVSRKDIFKDYSRQEFEKTFSNYFNIVEFKEIPDSGRVLYFMKRIKIYAQA